MDRKTQKRFILWSFSSIFLLFLLILAGGIVRSSGSGMGCPDWPRCFNKIIPPVSISELPAGYREVYVARRVKKNARAAFLFDKLGFHKFATSMRDDPSVKETEPFNVVNTYTEYINRLIGAAAGLVFLVTFIFSFVYRNSEPSIIVAWGGAVILMGIQGYLGSLVVSSNLLGFLISVHMLLALVILTLAIYGFTRASLAMSREVLIVSSKSGLFFFILFTVITLSAVQILTGTGVREAVDQVSRRFGQSQREAWVVGAGLIFSWHRELSVLVLIGTAVLYARIKRTFVEDNRLYRIGLVSLYLVGAQMLTGITLAYFALPPVSQALHIFIAALLFGNLVHLWFLSTSPGRTHMRAMAISEDLI